MAENRQIDSSGRLRHLLTVKDLPKKRLTEILDKAEKFLDNKKQKFKASNSLQGKTITNLFFEHSTRTRCSFEIAAKYLSAHVINLDITQSSTQKGETLLDTIHNLQVMGVDLFVIRHPESGIIETIANKLDNHAKLINAGDGDHEHPTQALLDMLTIRQHKSDFSQLRVAIIGDVTHSRVARSDIFALQTLGVTDIRVIGPENFLPKDCNMLGIQVFHDLTPGIDSADVIMTLRVQKERMQQTELPGNSQFYKQYGITKETLAHVKSDAIVMHPGPINRGIEIASEVADGPQSVILQQARNGVAIRMAVMSLLLKH